MIPTMQLGKGDGIIGPPGPGPQMNFGPARMIPVPLVDAPASITGLPP